MTHEVLPQPEFAPSLPPIAEDQLGTAAILARSEARRRIRQSLDACPQSDLYQIDELVRYAWDSQGGVEIGQIPRADRQKLLGELCRDRRCRILEHSPDMSQVVLAHDGAQFVARQQQVGIVIDRLILRLPPGATVTMDDFESVAAELGVLPEGAAEREQFARIFTFSHRVVFDREQSTVRLEDSPQQPQPDISALAPPRSLAELRRHGHLTQNLGNEASRNKLLSLRETLAAQAVKATTETQAPTTSTDSGHDSTADTPPGIQSAPSKKKLRLQRRRANAAAQARKTANAKADGDLLKPRSVPEAEPILAPTSQTAVRAAPKPHAPKPSDPRFTSETAAPLVEWTGPGSYQPQSYTEGVRLAPSLEHFSNEALAMIFTERLEQYVATHYPDPKARNESHIFRRVLGIHYDFMVASSLPRCRRAFRELLNRTSQLSRHGDLSVYVTMPPGVRYEAVQEMHDRLTALEQGAERIVDELLDNGQKRIKETVILHYAKHVARLELPSSMRSAFITILRNNPRLSFRDSLFYIFDTPGAKEDWASRHNRGIHREDPYSPI